MSESYTIYIPDDVIIFAVIAMIVALAFFVRSRRKTARTARVARTTRTASPAPRASNRREQLTTKIRGLEQRLAAFEHYATDPSRRLAAEIDALGQNEDTRERSEV